LFRVSRPQGPGERRLHAGFKLWLAGDDDSSSFGQGRWQLLQAIEREGSLRAAAASLEISYRKAWGDLKASEAALGVKLIEARRGGAAGGDTRLTPEGRAWLRAYGRFRSQVAKAVSRAFATSFKDLRP
jgi:molybdate transport system regulatory protein